MRKLALRPAVGAVAAVVVYLLIAAGVVNGLDVTNPGVYVVAAFAAGFSERYFLRLVNRAAALESTGTSSPVATERTAPGQPRPVRARP